MSNFSKIVRKDSLPSTDLPIPAKTVSLPNRDGAADSLPVPSFWNFANNEHGCEHFANNGRSQLELTSHHA